MARTEVRKRSGYEVRVLGTPRPRIADVYHALLQMRWRGVLAILVAIYLGLNALFGLAYWATGGVANAQPDSFFDAFFFSVQTMGTIGYGAMYPASRAAHALVVAESVVSLLVTAMATGVVFARFSQTRPRVRFTERVAIAPIDGVPTLMLRVGNERSGRIVDARFRLTLMRTQRTQEGKVIYRSVELRLVRERAPSLERAWMILHPLTPESPLYGATPESLREWDAELIAEVMGIDDTSLQTVFASHGWLHDKLAFGMQLVDIVSETPEGDVVLDLSKFHELEPAPLDRPNRAVSS